jgi:hypothetical protein
VRARASSGRSGLRGEGATGRGAVKIPTGGGEWRGGRRVSVGLLLPRKECHHAVAGPVPTGRKGRGGTKWRHQGGGDDEDRIWWGERAAARFVGFVPGPG